MEERRKRVHETDSEDELEVIESCQPKKIRSSTKNGPLVHQQRYRKEYSEKWPCLQQSSKGDQMVYCKLCNKDFSVAHGGKYDCHRHVRTKAHEIIEEEKKKMKNLTALFGMQTAKINREDDIAKKITHAEIGMVEMIAELNLPLSTASVLTTMFSKLFPDSKIAKGMQCGRSKATAVVKHLAKDAKCGLLERMKTGPFSISTDGSNDAESKQFPIVVRAVNHVTGLVESELLSIPICTGPATGENIFNLLDGEVGGKGVNWTNCIGLGVDNANVMVGKHKGVYGLTKVKHENIFLSGCTLHMIHNAAKKAAEALPNFDEALVDIFHYFQKSSARLARFKGDQELCGVEQRKMLKHVCTRWLSITRCIERMLKNWEALKTFFAQEQKLKQSSYAVEKVKSIFNFVRSPTNKLYALFLKFVHEEAFNDVLVAFQAEEPLIHLLGAHLRKLVKKIMTFFVKGRHMSGQDICQIKYKVSAHLKENDEIMIGDDARQYIKDKEANHLRESRIADFFTAVKAYYQTLVDYLLSRLPLSDPVLQHAAVADVDRQAEASVRSLEFFLDRYPCLLPEGVRKQKIVGQFNEYLCDNVSDCKKDRLDATWTQIGRQKDETGEVMYRELSHVMLGILTIPHSSAHCERIFSCVRKNKTDQRGSLGDDVLESLLVMKSRPGSYGGRVYNDSQLKAVKSAYKNELMRSVK